MMHDVAVTPDGERLIGVGTLLSSSDGLQPSRCRAEKRIIGRWARHMNVTFRSHKDVAYNLDRKEIEKYGFDFTIVMSYADAMRLYCCNAARYQCFMRSGILPCHGTGISRWSVASTR
jgi:hypothetical protein